jgi:hypothetical protein
MQVELVVQGGIDKPIVGMSKTGKKAALVVV